MFSRSTPALRRGRASCARRMPFVVRHSSATPGTARSMAHSSGISRRTRGSPPVMRILFTPNRAAGGALMGHLAGGAALYGASAPGDRGVGDALRLRGRQRHHPGSGGEPGGLAHRVGYWLPVAGFLHVPGEGIFSAYATGRAGAGDPCHPCGHVDGGAEGHPRAMLSRAVAGIRGSSLLLNLPGSEKAARENLAAVIGALEHGLHMIAAEGHE